MRSTTGVGPRVGVTQAHRASTSPKAFCDMLQLSSAPGTCQLSASLPSDSAQLGGGGVACSTATEVLEDRWHRRRGGSAAATLRMSPEQCRQSDKDGGVLWWMSAWRLRRGFEGLQDTALGAAEWARSWPVWLVARVSPVWPVVLGLQRPLEKSRHLTLNNTSAMTTWPPPTIIL